ncbi:MAG: hypothetical protein A9957_09530 [Methanohalophilus sp. DAL1]|nr:MAG: hypothetical protein A9957_09530 [Methanohalophilus sp. DAL1]
MLPLSKGPQLKTGGRLPGGLSAVVRNLAKRECGGQCEPERFPHAGKSCQDCQFTGGAGEGQRIVQRTE